MEWHLDWVSDWHWFWHSHSHSHAHAHLTLTGDIGRRYCNACRSHVLEYTRVQVRRSLTSLSCFFHIVMDPGICVPSTYYNTHRSDFSSLSDVEQTKRLPNQKRSRVRGDRHYSLGLDSLHSTCTSCVCFETDGHRLLVSNEWLVILSWAEGYKSHRYFTGTRGPRYRYRYSTGINICC